MKIVHPQDQVFWYLKGESTPPCRENIQTEVAIIGGGMAGLAAAQAFNKKGKKVVLLEQYFCGSGASGKSAGFVTPNAELSLTDFSQRFDMKSAQTIWNFITSGVHDIRSNIQQHTFDCDYSPQNSLSVATSKKALKELEIEHANLINLGYKASLYNAASIREKIGSPYMGGVEYENTFGINGYAYCQELKKHLEKNDVAVFEETPVTAINAHTITTPHATITADYIIVCADRFLPDLGLLKKEVYHAQTFIMVSQQLTNDQIQAIFPQNKLMAWDTELIYNYFRITGDNRLILGGGSVFNTYNSKPQHDNRYITNKLTNYFNKKFPKANVQFELIWPGLMGLSKDIAPVAGPDKDNKYMFYIAAVAGLPIAAALGRYSAEYLLEGNTMLDPYFSPYRKFPIGGIVQSLLGNKISFALSNLWKHNIP